MIEIHQISKSYEQKKTKTEVLKDISFTVADGEIVALLGHNGSGKSTLTKCIVGVIKPNSGYVRMDGRDSFKERNRLTGKMGVVFNQKPSFIADLPVKDNLLYFKAIYGLTREQYESRLAYLNNYLEIGDLYEKPYRKLSFGERIRCEIISVLLHSPHYIILDEPTIGLDYNAKRGLYHLLADLKEKEKICAIIITHEVDYIEGVCDKAVILSEGKVRYCGNPKQICREAAKYLTIRVQYEGIRADVPAQEILTLAVETEPEKQTFVWNVARSEKEAAIRKVTDAFFINSITTDNSSLREVFENVLKKVDGMS